MVPSIRWPWRGCLWLSVDIFLLIRLFGLICEYHFPVLEHVDESTGESSGFLKVDSQKMGFGQEIAFHCDPVLVVLIDHLKLVSARVAHG